MKLRSVRIKNYKSFNDSEQVYFAPDINIVTGQNNAGKTALLRALALAFSWTEHLSTTSRPDRNQWVDRPTEVEFDTEFTGLELKGILEPKQLVQLQIPENRGHAMPHPLGIPYIPNDPNYFSPANIENIWDFLFQKAQIAFKLTRVAGKNFTKIDSTQYPSHDMFELPRITNQISVLHRQLDAGGNGRFHGSYGGPVTDIGVQIFEDISARIYRFSPERFGLGDGKFGANRALRSDASNLAEVLNALQSNSALYSNYIDLVRYIFPQISWVSVEPDQSHDETRLRTKIWTIDKQSYRDDLAIPLTESGTGLGQVLSILYVVFTSQFSKVLLIDEPQSFLHPGAARKLIEIIKQFSQHQYIITTHSPSIISAASPEKIFILRNENGSTKIEETDAGDTRSLQEFLNEVGASLSDVFGMDQVIWVEGPTEEIAFPYLIQKLSSRHKGTGIVSIRNTGDLEGKDARRIFEIYNNLTRKASLLPPAIAFILDSETRTEREMVELRKISNDKAQFLPVRMFENYLLDSEAIYAIFSAADGFPFGQEITKGNIVLFIYRSLEDRKYWKPHEVPHIEDIESISEEDLDLTKINAAELLKDLFGTLSGHQLSYQKTIHSIQLFKWILDNKPSKLASLESLLRQFFE